MKFHACAAMKKDVYVSPACAEEHKCLWSFFSKVLVSMPGVNKMHLVFGEPGNTEVLKELKRKHAKITSKLIIVVLHSEKTHL
eukprot:9666158-Karenia_brevis.AAC.1